MTKNLNHSFDIGYTPIPCNLSQTHLVECQDNDTPDDLSDDYYNLSLNVILSGGSDNYIVKINNYSSPPISSNIITTIIGDGQNGNPDLPIKKISNYLIRLEDAIDGLCYTDFEINDTIKYPDVFNICTGDSVLVFGTYVKTSDIISKTFVSPVGCEYIQTIEVIVEPLLEKILQYSICMGDSTFVVDRWFSDEGIFSFSKANLNQCDSFYIVHISLLNPTKTFDTLYLCSGDTISIFGSLIYKESDLMNTYLGLNGCDSQAFVHISLLDDVNTDVSYIMCYGDSILINDVWISEEGLFNEMLNSVDGCDSINTIKVSIIYPPEPIMNNWGILKDTLFLNKEKVTVDLELDPNEWAVKWSPSDIVDCDTCSKVVITPNEDAFITVHYEHRSGSNCIFESTFFLKRVIEGIYIPNVFSPNGDGINDKWIPLHTPNITLLRLEIYDRWGELVYKSLRSNEDKTAPWIEVKAWDGHLNNQALNPAVFAYVVDYLNYKNEVKIAYGDVTLVK